MSSSYHAKLSPSSSDRWTSCTASVNAQEGIPNESSEASRDGTMCHQIAEEVLRDHTDPQSYLGRKLVFWATKDSRGEMWADAPDTHGPVIVEAELTVLQEHIDAVVTATEFVQQLHTLHGGELEAEQQVPIGHFTGEKGASGRSDVILMTPKRIITVDFKFGRTKVYAYEVLEPAGTDIITGKHVPEVVRGNLQMSCYALGAIEKHGMFYDFEHVTMIIAQPFVQHVSEYTCTVEDLFKVRDFLAEKAEETRVNPQFVPSSSNCHFCRASGNCAAQTEAVAALALDGFTDLENAAPARQPDYMLGNLYALLPMVSDWCDAIAKRTRDALSAGLPVTRDDGLSYKLVAGKMGGRDWVSEEKAEEAMLSMRLGKDVMYERKLLSPAKLEKFAKAKKVKKGEQAEPPVIGPTKWERLKKLITQERGQPVIAIETDPRPAVSSTDGFDDVGSDTDLNSDLF